MSCWLYYGSMEWLVSMFWNLHWHCPRPGQFSQENSDKKNCTEIKWTRHSSLKGSSRIYPLMFKLHSCTHVLSSAVSIWCSIHLVLMRIFSLGKICMNQIRLSKIISDQKIWENAWGKELLHKLRISWIFWLFFENAHERKPHHWNPQKPKTWCTSR